MLSKPTDGPDGCMKSERRRSAAYAFSTRP
jgi:hypothetical protein